MNTAVLTGRQVSQVMKVFIVTQAGKVADVTLQSSCHVEDESVIKVRGIFFPIPTSTSSSIVSSLLRLNCLTHPHSPLCGHE
jgi:hypothetical protein